MRAALLLLLLLVVPFLAVPPASAQATIDLSIWTAEVRPLPVASEPTDIHVKVNSTGPGLARINFQWGDGAWLNGGDGSSSFLLSNVSTGTNDFTLSFTPPAERKGPQQIRIEVQSQAQSDSDTRNNTFVLATIVRVAKLNLTFEEPLTRDVVPQGETALRYFVRNDGNVEDNATPHLELDPGPWTLHTYGPLPPIPPGQSVTGVLLVKSTSSTDLRNMSLNVTVRSSISGAGATRVQAPNFTINESAHARLPKANVTGLTPTAQVFPDENVTVPFTVGNPTPYAVVYRVTPSIQGAPAGWTAEMRMPPTWPANLSQPVESNRSFPVFLRPNETVPLLVNVTRASTAPNITAVLRIEVNSTDGDRITNQTNVDLRAVATTQLTDAGPDLVPRVVASPPVLYQGDTTFFRVEVLNAGRGNATNSTLHLELRDNLRTLEEADLQVPPLGPGNSTNLTWSPPTSGLQGPYVLLGRVDANASQLDRNPANNTLRLDLHVRAPTLTVRAPEALRVVPGGRLVVSSATGGLSVENLGDKEETLLVKLDSNLEWLRAEWRVSVPPGTRHPIAVDLDVPAVPGTREVTATFSAAIENRTRFSASTTFTVEVDDLETPDVTILSPSGNGRVGVETRLAVKATDASGVRRAEVILRTPDGERVALPLQRDPAEADVYATRHTPFTPGAYVLEFRVEDGSGQALSAAVRNLTWQVDGSSYRGLKPVNFGEGAFVGRTPLKFAEVDADTTRSALVDAGDGFRPLPPPYEVQLPAVEGPRVIVVNATAKDGTRWEGRWNVTVDLTPPTLAEPTTRDAGDGRIELSVRANDARDAVARFQTDTGPVEVPLTGRGGGLFGATATAPESWSSITFVATDVAGNPGTAVLEAPKNDAPGPALALVLVGIVAAAIALRRRG